MYFFTGSPYKKLPDTEVNSGVEEEIVTCGKSVLIGEKANVLEHMDYFKRNYPWIKFNMVSKQASIPGKPFGWEFETSRHSSIVNRLVFLLESGIYDKLNEYLARNEFKKRFKGTQVILKKKILLEAKDRIGGVKLSEGIQTVFIIWTALILLSGICFLGETGTLNMSLGKLEQIDF